MKIEDNIMLGAPQVLYREYIQHLDKLTCFQYLILKIASVIGE